MTTRPELIGSALRGDAFALDRLFGTWHRVKPHEIRYGLDEFSEDRQHRVGYLLTSPFKKLKKRINQPEKRTRRWEEGSTAGMH